MILKNCDYNSLAKKIIDEKRKIIVYGAGMIGQIIVPHIIEKYNLINYVDFFVEANTKKTGESIDISGKSYEIKSPDCLHKCNPDTVILITNSKFVPVVEFLNTIKELDNVEGYIIPIMQIQNADTANPINIEKYSDKQLIPKVINYCWFGGKSIPDFLKKCIMSWKDKCPDYDIIEWNESNYDINRHKYTKEAYEAGNYGFVSDVARLDILYENGGVYLDTDVELLKNIDDCLYQKGFIGVEKWGNINSGCGCGFIKGHPMLKKLIDYRNNYPFVMSDGSFNCETNGMYESKLFMDVGFKPDNTLQIINGVTVYPSYINCPYDYVSCKNNIKEQTLSVHYYSGGWMSKEEKMSLKKTQMVYDEMTDTINCRF